MAHIEFAEKPVHICACFSARSHCYPSSDHHHLSLETSGHSLTSFLSSTLDLSKCPQHIQTELLKTSSGSFYVYLSMVFHTTRDKSEFPWCLYELVPVYHLFKLDCADLPFSPLMCHSSPFLSWGLPICSVLTPEHYAIFDLAKYSSFLSLHEYCGIWREGRMWLK